MEPLELKLGESCKAANKCCEQVGCFHALLSFHILIVTTFLHIRVHVLHSYCAAVSFNFFLRFGNLKLLLKSSDAA